MIRPLFGWVTGDAETAARGKKARRAKSKTRAAGAGDATTEHSEYPFTLADLEVRDTALHEALDLRAIVSRIK